MLNNHLRFFVLPVLIVITAFGLRLGAAYFWQSRITGDSGLYFGDSETYWLLAEAVSQGKPYQFEEWQVFRMPGYPIVLAPLFWLYGGEPPVMAARMENALIGSLLVVAVGFFAFQLFRDRRIALWASLFAACEPCTIITSVWVLSETPFCLAMIAQLAALTAAIRTTRKTQLVLYAAWFAVLSALTVYFRPSWLYFSVFSVFMSMIYSQILSKNAEIPALRSHVRVMILIAVFLPVFCFCMTPWWVRNYQVTGRFVATTLQLGPSLYDGLNPSATGASNMAFTDEFRQREREHPISFSHDTYEYRVNERTKNASLEWAKAHPGRVCELAVIKFVRLWNVWPNEPAFGNLIIRLIVFVTYTPILGLALIGFGKSWFRGFDDAVLILPAIYLTMLHIIFVSSLRYRVPAMLCLMILASSMIVSLHKKRCLASTKP
ncbi:MAG: phospholipid carrier-dependent glycosyltransferase [Planctomycetaceae bacterium]|nr:phospholipid carrier-dependent glycosyltransferase [Planctomycetaceae bacterium]